MWACERIFFFFFLLAVRTVLVYRLACWQAFRCALCDRSEARLYLVASYLHTKVLQKECNVVDGCGATPSAGRSRSCDVET